MEGGCARRMEEGRKEGSTSVADGRRQRRRRRTTTVDAGENESVSERAGRACGDKVGIVVARLPKRATDNQNSSSALHINRYC